MSEWLRQTFIESFAQAPEKVVVVVGGGSDLTGAFDGVDRAWDPPRFLFVGRELERKGGRELLTAWPAVRAQCPTAELRIVGPRAIEEKLPAGVTLVGHIDRSTPAGHEAYLDLLSELNSLRAPLALRTVRRGLLGGHGTRPAVHGRESLRRAAMPERRRPALHPILRAAPGKSRKPRPRYCRFRRARWSRSPRPPPGG